MSMVDISDKPKVFREATAKGIIKLKPETVRLIEERKISKGDTLDVAKVAGILAAKRTSTLIPLCHPLPLTNLTLEANIVDSRTVEIAATIKTEAQTGVEMEALTATTIALLTIWDMAKQYEKDSEGQYPSTEITDIHVMKKVKKA